MANRRLNQFRYSIENMPTDIWMNVSFGANGAATLVSGKNQGISSISAPTASGAYTITLQDNFARLLEADASFIAAGAPAAPEMVIREDNSAAAGKTIKVVFYAPDGSTATCPASGEVGLIHLVLKNSSV